MPIRRYEDDEASLRTAINSILYLVGKDYHPGGAVERLTRERESTLPAEAPTSEFYSCPLYHGYMTRGELNDPVMQENIQLGVQRACDFFNKCIPA
jgi:hypothetical protein